ncbi:MAG: hypothetical protein K6A14_02255 [Erysipelotrichaceae bacterium]|nr:hypothetical protein [Erysipelotrichaceae bacterium]
MSAIREIRDPQGRLLGYGAVPDGWLYGGSLVDKRQSESVPFFITAHLIDASRNIMIFGLTDEMYTTHTNKFTKMMLKSVPNVIWDSIRDFVEPEDYLKQFAEAISQMKLTATGQADLPSVVGKNIQNYYNEMMETYKQAFDIEAQLGTPTYANNSVMKSFMVRYEGVAKSGVSSVVIAGMDYKGVEYYTNTSPLSVISPLGGILGSALKSSQAKKGSTQFGHGKPCDAIDWGSANKFAMVAPAEYEKEATEVFLQFVMTFHMDDQLRQQFYQANNARKQENIQQTLQFQQMAQQSMINLQANQARLQQTLANNSAAMHNMIMDSWNQKMASDSRISAARSEAIMGTNTYTNSYGQNVSVDVTADHVYQNQFGDVYGVSGNAPDDELLNKLNWREIKK